MLKKDTKYVATAFTVAALSTFIIGCGGAEEGTGDEAPPAEGAEEGAEDGEPAEEGEK